MFDDRAVEGVCGAKQPSKDEDQRAFDQLLANLKAYAGLISSDASEPSGAFFSYLEDGASYPIPALIGRLRGVADRLVDLDCVTQCDEGDWDPSLGWDKLYEEMDAANPDAGLFVARLMLVSGPVAAHDQKYVYALLIEGTRKEHPRSAALLGALLLRDIESQEKASGLAQRLAPFTVDWFLKAAREGNKKELVSLAHFTTQFRCVSSVMNELEMLLERQMQEREPDSSYWLGCLRKDRADELSEIGQKEKALEQYRAAYAAYAVAVQKGKHARAAYAQGELAVGPLAQEISSRTAFCCFYRAAKAGMSAALLPLADLLLPHHPSLALQIMSEIPLVHAQGQQGFATLLSRVQKDGSPSGKGRKLLNELTLGLT